MTSRDSDLTSRTGRSNAAAILVPSPVSGNFALDGANPAENNLLCATWQASRTRLARSRGIIEGSGLTSTGSFPRIANFDGR
jgi:hypothetical protein